MANDSQLIEERRDMDPVFISQQAKSLGFPTTERERQEGIDKRTQVLMTGDTRPDGTVIPPMPREEAEKQARFEYDSQHDDMRLDYRNPVF